MLPLHWQVDIKINMENKSNLIEKFIKKDFNENVKMS